MKILVSGIGTGDYDMITLRALNEAKSADVIIVPRSKSEVKGVAEKIITHHLPDKTYLALTFPMTTDEAERQRIITLQVKDILPQLEGINTIFFPVIGDAMLYSTGKYFVDAMKSLVPDVNVSFIPGISAHSSAASCAKRFLAMKSEIFTIIPGTASPSRIRSALEVCDGAAIYKPTAIHDIHSLVDGFNVIRVDYAGFPDLERVTYGDEALNDIHDYLSILLLWRD